MNFELFIAKRIVTSKQHKSSISSPIIKIAITAIALGMIIMMISVASGVGLQHKIREKISGFKGHVQITNYDNNNSEITQNPISKHQDFYPEFQNIKGIKNVQLFASKFGVIRTETDFEGIVLKGVAKDYNWDFFESYLTEGTFPDFSEKRTNDVLISKMIADRLNLKLHEKFDVFFVKDEPNKLPNRRSFKIVGIYNSGYKDFDESYIIGDVRHIQKLNKWSKDEVGGFEVLLEDFDELSLKGNEIYAATGSTLNSTTIVESFPAIFEWLSLFDTNIIVILGIMIMVAGINMITALLVLILERTQMIGVLKALGSTNVSIRKVFLYNASYLILRGLFWGNLIGLSILLIQKYFGVISLNPETYYVNKVPVYLNLLHIVLLNVGTLILCLTMLLIPSYIITKISPAKAVKFE